MSNVDRFTHVAELYAKYRPGYPKELFDFLYTDGGFSAQSTIADVGAGTGIFTAELLSRGSRVYAVEPNADMRRKLLSYLKSEKNLITIAADAENTTLEDHSIDFVTVAQAFHWFNNDSFSRECRRILKPGGKVVLVWNTRDSASSLVQENEKIFKELCPDFHGFSGGNGFSASFGETPSKVAEFYSSCVSYQFINNLVYTKESFIGKSLSSSYSPKLEDLEYEPFIEAISGLFDRYQSPDGTLLLPNFVRCYFGTV